LNQALIENQLFSISQEYLYLNHWLAFGQSLFLVEVPLHDDSALAGAFTCENPLASFCPEGPLAVVE